MKLTIDSICLIGSIMDKIKIDDNFIEEMLLVGKTAKGKDKKEIDDIKNKIGMKIVLKLGTKIHEVRNELVKFISIYKDITEKDERVKEIEDLKKQNADLNAQIAHSKTIKDVNSIFKKAELNVDDDILNMVANTDAEITASNAKAIINLVNKAREDGRNSILKGKTPRSGGNKIKDQDTDLKRALGLEKGFK